MELVKRALFTIKEGLSRRRQLRRILEGGSCASITLLSQEMLAAAGCRVLVLDFDGVLAPHGYREPLPEVTAWLDRCIGFAGLHRVYLLSNKPSPAREAFFRNNYPTIVFVRDVRKKPYPDGLLGIARDEAVHPRQVLIVDDRLLTGILAAVLAETESVYISHPYRDFRGSTVAETFFALLRWLERIVVRTGA
jgi:predicted HAD superfamily phosphohydrolase YqeG